MIGKTVSHYKILEKLSQGGMGVVYKAEDTKLKRTVALKFLLPELTRNQEAKERFIYEARAASSLQHNNLCTIHDIDETEDGRMFICMDYYEGEPLNKKLENGPLEPGDAIDIITQIAMGLSKAHEQGIIHRDIKSSNIMITKDGVAKIVDFGLAKLAGQIKLTKTNSTIGTVAYMSPEQARGEKVDHRTDLWSMGVVFYEMLTGLLPFKGDYEAAVIYSILNEEPERITDLHTDVPVEIEKIVQKTISKNPADRYQNTEELLEKLKNIKGQFESNAVTSSHVKSRKRFLKNRLFLLSSITFLVLILLGIGYLLKTHKVKSPEKMIQNTWQNSIAVLPFKNISSDPEQDYFCDGMTEQIITNLSRLQKIKVIARTSIMKFKNSAKSIPEIGKELNVEHILEGSIRKSKNRIRVTTNLINTNNGLNLWANEYDRELTDLFAVQDNVSENIAQALLQKLINKETEIIKTDRPKNIEAYEYYLKGKYFHDQKYFGATFDDEYFKLSETMYKKAIALDPDYALAYAGLADLYNTFYNFEEKSKQELDRALELQQKYINIAYRLEPNSATVIRIRGLVYEAQGDRKNEYTSLIRALKIDPNDHKNYYSLGVFFKGRGLQYKAIPLLTKAIELNPLDPISYVVRGISYFRTGELDHAKSDYETALEIEPNYLNALWVYAGLLIKIQKYNEAEKILTLCSKINPDDRDIPAYQALIYAAKGQKEKALEIKIDTIWQVDIYSLLGMKDEAISLLNKIINKNSYKKRDLSIYLSLKNNQYLDNLRNENRFKKILAEEKRKYEELLEKYNYN